MYLPGMGAPARGTMIGAGAASANGKRARSIEVFMLAGVADPESRGEERMSLYCWAECCCSRCLESTEGYAVLLI